MAIAPTFIADMTTLKSKLRLSATAQPDALAMIDTAIEVTRVTIVNFLGTARVNELRGKTYSENGFSNDEIIRTKANNVELMMVRLFLLRTMPILFMDSSGAKREVWNDEGFTRRAQKGDLQQEIDNLELLIGAWLGELGSDTLVVENIQGGVLNAIPICRSPISITRSIQGGYDHIEDQYRQIFPVFIP